jgi:hypothetical protein
MFWSFFRSRAQFVTLFSHVLVQATAVVLLDKYLIGSEEHKKLESSDHLNNGQRSEEKSMANGRYSRNVNRPYGV